MTRLAPAASTSATLRCHLACKPCGGPCRQRIERVPVTAPRHVKPTGPPGQRPSRPPAKTPRAPPLFKRAQVAPISRIWAWP